MKKNIIFNDVEPEKVYEQEVKQFQRGFKMSQQEMKKFMETQVSWIEVAKWYEGEKLGRDPGEEFVAKWVKEHGAEFRKWWNENH